jgi:hypothetical protein
MYVLTPIVIFLKDMQVTKGNICAYTYCYIPEDMQVTRDNICAYTYCYIPQRYASNER